MKFARPNRVTRTYVQHPVAEPARGTDAAITYSHASLGPRGDAFVAAFTEEHDREMMRNWDTHINHYLEHGRALGAGD